MSAITNNTPKLTSLNLSGCYQITDAGSSKLAHFRNLTSLDLSRCSVTCQGLSELPKIRELNLESCVINNQQLAELTNLTNLTSLRLSWCNKITDQGLRAFSNLSKLNFLSLKGCEKISDNGLFALTNLTNLTHLDLEWNRKITDQGVIALTNLTNLTFLSISHEIKANGSSDLAQLASLNPWNNLTLEEKRIMELFS